MLEKIVGILPVSLTTQALLLGLTVGVVTYYTFIKKKYKLPPGPRALPLIGNLIEINASSDPLFVKCMNWRKTYGPVITVYMGPLAMVTLNNAVVTHEALVKKAADFAGRFQTYSMGALSSDYKDIIFADVSPSWKHLRKIAHQGLRQYLTGSALEKKVFESSFKVINRIKGKQGQPFDIKTYISLIVFNLINSVCFNKSFDIDDDKFRELLSILDHSNDDFGLGFWEDVFPPLRIFPTARFKRVISSFDTFRDFIRQECTEHRDKFSEDDLNDFTDFLINARKQAIQEDPEVDSIISDEHITLTVSDIFLAGVDTTRQTITWTILLLVQHPEIQIKVQAELDEVFDAKQCPTVNDRERMPYTEAVLHESMRLCPVVPIGVPHKTQCDTTIGEYEIPEGTMILVNHYALHRDPDYWQEPDVFKPERFLDENGKLAPKTLSWLPFSSGRRNCLGETIARPEMHLILAILLRNMTFSCQEGMALNMKAEGALVFPPPHNMLIATERQ